VTSITHETTRCARACEQILSALGAMRRNRLLPLVLVLLAAVLVRSTKFHGPGGANGSIAPQQQKAAAAAAVDKQHGGQPSPQSVAAAVSPDGLR
jgi:hypothetical protein